MKIAINGTVYENVQWDEPTMTMETDATLGEIEAAFAPGVNADIIVSEGNQEVARYYNKGIESIKVTGNSPRTVMVVFDLTQIAANAETEIRESMEYNDEAISELACMIADIYNSNIHGLYEEIKHYFTNMLREENGVLNQFNIRISALEHEAGIVSIEPNVEVKNDG